jgi:ketosteroid isomerase-like protein
MKKIMLLLFVLFLSCQSFAQVSDADKIEILLAQQVNAWNQGDIKGYMHGYWHSDSLLFIGNKGPQYGYDATLKHYMQAYPNITKMGNLKLEIESLKMLSDDYYFVVGSWFLKRTVGDLKGSYTLLVKKIRGQWLIVCDHSS